MPNAANIKKAEELRRDFQTLMGMEGISGIGEDQYTKRGESYAYAWLLDTFPHALLEDSAYSLACGIANAKPPHDPFSKWLVSEGHFPAQYVQPITKFERATVGSVLEQIVTHLNLFLANNELERAHVINFERSVGGYLSALQRGRIIHELTADSIYSMLLDRPVHVKDGRAVYDNLPPHILVIPGVGTHARGAIGRDPDATGGYGPAVKALEEARR